MEGRAREMGKETKEIRMFYVCVSTLYNECDHYTLQTDIKKINKIMFN